MDAWIKNLMCGTQRCAVWSPVRGTPQASIQRNAGAVYKGVCNVLLMFSLRGFDWFSLAGTSWQAPTASSGAWSRHVSSWESWRPGSKHVGKHGKTKVTENERRPCLCSGGISEASLHAVRLTAFLSLDAKDQWNTMEHLQHDKRLLRWRRSSETKDTGISQ